VLFRSTIVLSAGCAVIAGVMPPEVIRIINTLVSSGLNPFRARTVNENVAAVFVNPEITPEFVFNDNPLGKLPFIMSHVMGWVPVAAREAL